jgi:acyl-CoA synthetase (AMP-forming)/AMP-acid ligase II
MTKPPEPRTLIDLLLRRAETAPEAIAFQFSDVPYTFAWLWEHLERFACHVRQCGVAEGDRVVLAVPNGPDFFSSFYGVIHAGAVSVPIFPGSDPERCLNLMRLCDARHLVVTRESLLQHAEAFDSLAGTEGVTLIAAGTDNLESRPFRFLGPRPEDIAFIQYTSGSTSDPRGVQLSHRNLLTNVRQMIAGMEITSDDIFVSWLPTYHDMGLILMTMAPFVTGAELVLLPASLRRVSRWLQAIHDHRGTFTAAPDTAYRLCVRGVRSPDRYDLSSLRVALNAAEPVRRSTMEEFEEAFALQHVMVAGYGLAEATVGVSMWPPGTPKSVDPEGHVSVGPAFPEIDIRIVDGEGSLPAGAVGEIAVRSPANTRGYYHNPEANSALFWNREYILTGDLGYLDEDGDLFIVSRKKDLIIQAGRSLYPADVEETLSDKDEVRHVAVVGVERRKDAGELLFVFAELKRHSQPDEAASLHLTASIVQRIHSRFGLRPGRVYLLKPRSLPFTENGKLQRQKLKKLYASGHLRESGRILYPNY